MEFATQNCMTEFSLASARSYEDPLQQVSVDAIFTAPDESERVVPAFWAGGDIWKVRYASSLVGRHRYRTACTDAGNPGLHGQRGEVEVRPYVGDNPLFLHGPLRVSEDRCYLEHQDGTPFFWLADTWWLGLCERLEWPGGFQTIARDRVQKGFTVIQIVAGLYPDMPPFDPRGANEAGFPWEKEYARINPAYFDMADQRINHLVESGLLPCLVGCWGYFLPLMGVEKMKQHWRNLIARWGAYPAIWCLAGEATMPYYLSKDRDSEAAMQKRGWTEVARYVRTIDPYKHVVTIHPCRLAHEELDDPTLLDFDMLQTGSNGFGAIPGTVATMAEAMAFEPRMPVINGEVCYEGQFEGNREEIQWFMFWSSMLSGAAGHTYGAMGIWQFNTREEPFGPSPWGAAWGNHPWQDAYQWPGSRQLGLAKQLLCRYEWWRFEPHQEWVEPRATLEEPFQPYAAGIPGGVRIVYLPRFITPWSPPHYVRGLDPGTSYRVFFFNPVNAQEMPVGWVRPDGDGTWRIPLPPVTQPWVVVIEPARG